MRLTATDGPASLGPQDYVFITMKTHQHLEALDSIPSLFGSTSRPGCSRTSPSFQQAGATINGVESTEFRI